MLYDELYDQISKNKDNTRVILLVIYRKILEYINLY